MWDVREKRTEEGWAKGLSKLFKETVDTARTWISLILAAAAVRYLGQTSDSQSMIAVSLALEFLAYLALWRFFLLEMGIVNLTGRTDKIGMTVDAGANLILFGLSFWFLKSLTGQLVEAIASLQQGR